MVLQNRFHRLLSEQFVDVGTLALLQELMLLVLPPFPSFLSGYHFVCPFAGLDDLDFVEHGLAYEPGLVQTNPSLAWFYEMILSYEVRIGLGLV